MGMAIGILFFFLLFMLACLAAGMLIAFVLLPIACWLFRVSNDRCCIAHRFKLRLALWIAGIAFVVPLACISIRNHLLIARESHDFTRDSGGRTIERIPLDYPYDLTWTRWCGKEIEGASLSVWRGVPTASSSVKLRNVQRYFKDGPILVGETQNPSGPNTNNIVWFSFDCRSGNGQTFSNKDEYLAAIQLLGYTNEPGLQTLRDHQIEFHFPKSREPNHTSEGIRRPADGPPKPSM